ncbi:MAG: hypothetical protein JO107_13360, partial [Hyphomicrobiales bacterium]|nr:hypothetical protein [Hyphomicrobiales bacterium]
MSKLAQRQSSPVELRRRGGVRRSEPAFQVRQVTLAWTTGQRLVFERNADYFRDRPNLDGFRVEIGQEPLVAILRLQKGEVDIAGDGVPPAKYLELKNSPEAADLIVDRAQFETSYITINTTKKPFDDVRVRQ